MGLRMRGSLRLKVGDDGRPHQLSGLAWDEDQQRLYALSDDAYIVHLVPLFNNGMLSKTRLLAIYPLRDAAGAPLRGRDADSEGLHARYTHNGERGDSELVVSFEQRPRIERYSATGVLLGGVALPPALSRDDYAGSNQQLEAVTESSRYGLLTATERPLRSGSQNSIAIYAVNGKQRWHYPLRDRRHGAVVALEMLNEDEVLVLERRFVSFWRPLTISLSLGRLTTAPNSLLAMTEIAHFESSRGWSLDNFEGLGRHRGRCYFMVSDDNRNPLQRTILTYIEILPLHLNDTTARLPAAAASIQPGCTDGFDNRAGGR